MSAPRTPDETDTKQCEQQQQPPPAVPMGSKAGSGSSAQQNEVLVMGLYLSKTLSLLSVLVGGGVEWLISN